MSSRCNVEIFQSTHESLPQVCSAKQNSDPVNNLAIGTKAVETIESTNSTRRAVTRFAACLRIVTAAVSSVGDKTGERFRAFRFASISGKKSAVLAIASVRDRRSRSSDAPAGSSTCVSTTKQESRRLEVLQRFLIRKGNRKRCGAMNRKLISADSPSSRLTPLQ